MNRQEEKQQLKFSDVASELHAKILKNPYKFLGVSDNASFEEVRRRYIAQAKLYHPDMVNPSFDSQALVTRYTAADLEAVLHFSNKKSDSNPKELLEDLKATLLAVQNTTEADQKKQARALETIQAAAHEKMVQLNTAFEAIKLRINPKQQNMLAGYDTQTFSYEGYSYQQINLEGKGEVTIDSSTRDFFMSGAELWFDWETFPNHPYEDRDIGFQQSLFIKHLFVYKELQDGRQQISQVLLQPFFEHFRLDSPQQETFMRLLVANKDSENIMEELAIPPCSELDHGGPLSDDWFYSRRFQQYTNEMQTLDSSTCSYENSPITMRFENEQLFLDVKYRSETVFSSTDVILLETLAYGPMLSSK